MIFQLEVSKLASSCNAAVVCIVQSLNHIPNSLRNVSAMIPTAVNLVQSSESTVAQASG